MTNNGIKAILRLHHVEYITQDGMVLALEPIAFGLGVWHVVTDLDSLKSLLNY